MTSQFTLYGSCPKGNRLCFYEAMLPDQAKKAYEAFATKLKKAYSQVQEGVFEAMMHVELINDGSVIDYHRTVINNIQVA